MSRIAEDIIQDIRDRINIVEVVSQYVALKRSGANHQGLCPFHQEKTPSFNVNEPRQIFHCFGCGVGGNVFTFLMRMEGLNFPEAVKRIGEKVGIEVEEKPVTREEIERRETYDRLIRVNETAGKFYHQLLLEDERGGMGRRYLRKRGYDGETVRSFQLGYAPEQWEALTAHLLEQGFSSGEIRQSGLSREGKQGRGDYDLFRSRLLFPIFDLQGRVVAFGGRILDDSLPKYINSPETPVYHKGRTLYGLFRARDTMRQTGEALVVEGYFDVLALQRAGFETAVATCGTAMTPDHARLLKRYAEQVLLIFDEDAAGRQATFRAMDVLLPEGLTVKVVSLAAGDDPDSLIKKQGVAAFQACLDKAQPVIEVFLQDQLNIHGESVEGRARAAQEVMARIRRLPDDLTRNLYVKRLAELTGLDEGLLQQKSQQSAPPQPARPRQPMPSGPAEARPVPRPKTTSRSQDKAQTYLLKLMALNDGRWRSRIRQDGVASLFLDELYRGVASRFLQAEDADGRLPENLSLDGLDAEQQALATGLLLSGDESWADEAEQIFNGCQRTVRHALLKAQLQDVNRREEAAKHDGDQPLVEQCQRERTKINAELKKKH